jgi:chromosomal replication initiation ATPase DnaA
LKTAIHNAEQKEAEEEVQVQSDSDSEQELDHEITDVMALSRKNHEFQVRSQDDLWPDHDWTTDAQNWPHAHPDNIWIWELIHHHGDANYRMDTSVDLDNLNEKQHLVCAIVKEKLASKKQFTLMIRGSAGVGKPHVIKALTKVALQHLPPEGFALCTPTGCAAFNIGGCTLSKALHIAAH